MSHVLAKRVTMWEFFYDLIFVFAISKMTHMIHHLHQGMVNWMDFGLFALVTIIVMQAWMYQTTYVNKFGEGRLTDQIGLWINMIGAIYVAVSINTDWSQTFYPFNIGMLIMQLAIFFQFWFARKDYEKGSDEHQEINAFLTVIGLVSAAIGVGLLLGYQIGIWIMVAAYLVQAYLPWAFKHQFLGDTLNFPHLVERCGLITIILFGESIVGLTSIVSAGTPHLISLLIFFSLIFMFAAYQIQTEEIMNHGAKSNGMFLMHLHLLLPIGLMTVTAGWGYLIEDVNKTVLVLFLLLGMAIYYVTLYATSRYNKAAFPLTGGDILHYVGVFVIGGILAFLLKDLAWGIPAAMVLLSFGMLIKNALKVKRAK